jgi:hypothetical protein
VDRTDFRDFHEVFCARQKSCVVLRFVLDSVSFRTPTLSEFPDLGSHGLFFGFSSPQKKTSRRLRSFKRIFYYEDLLLDPFQRIRRVPCFSGLLFFHLHRSQQRPQRHQDRRAANPAGRRRTTQEAQVRSFPNIISHLQEQSLHFARVGYLRLSRPQQFFGREITSLLLLYRLSLSRILSCVCV